MTRLVVGLGSHGRGDDAAGLLAVERLRESGIAAAVARSGADLLELWQAADEVTLIDAVVSGGTPGTVRVWESGYAVAAAAAFRFSSHGMGLREALALAEALGQRAPKLTVWGIEAGCCDRGAPVTPEVARAAGEVAERIATRCRSVEAETGHERRV